MTIKTLINLGTNPDDHTGDSLRASGPKINALVSKTYVATAAQFGGATKESTISNTIAAATTDGALYVLIPAKYDLDDSSMLPYNASLITGLAAFHVTGGRLIREGGNHAVYDVKAYGAAVDN